jgi:hypothetical protein
MRHHSRKTAVAVAFGSAVMVLSLVIGGCNRGRPEPTLKEIPTSRLTILTALKEQYTSQLGKKPATEEDFKAFVSKTASPDMLAKANATRAEDLFVSERDQKPFVIFLGGKAGTPAVGEKKGSAPPGVFAYEQEGKDGKRLVSFIGGVKAMDDVQFKQAVPGAK